MNLSHLERSLHNWAQRCESVTGVGVVGSYARGSQHRDSDIDVIVIACDPGDLLDNVAWVDRFGTLISPVPEDYGLVQSLRCLGGDGIEIEFGVAGPEWHNLPIDAATAAVIRNGLLIVYDPGAFLLGAIEWVARHENRQA